MVVARPVGGHKSQTCSAFRHAYLHRQFGRRVSDQTPAPAAALWAVSVSRRLVCNERCVCVCVRCIVFRAKRDTIPITVSQVCQAVSVSRGILETAASERQWTLGQATLQSRCLARVKQGGPSRVRAVSDLCQVRFRPMSYSCLAHGDPVSGPIQPRF